MKDSRKRKNAPSKVKQPAPKTASVESPRKPFPLKNLFLYGCLAAVLLFIFVVRQRLSAMPLERDEGEYALMGQLILKGIAPYEMAYNMKLPGTYYSYALIMALFGQSAVGIHTGLLIVNLASTLLLFFIGKKLANEAVGVMAAASFALLSVAPGSFGFAAHATHFNALAGLGGFLLLLQHFERPALWRLMASGFCFGLSFVMKQHAVFLMIFGITALALFEKQRRPLNLKASATQLGAFGFSLVLPYLLVVVSAMATGTFEKFWHWTVQYAGEYASIATYDQALNSLKSNFPTLSKGVLAFWVVGLAGLAALFFSETARKHRWTLLLFVFFSLLCLSPGLYFRHHYFILFFPALALLAGVAMDFLGELLSRWRPDALRFMPLTLFALMFFVGIDTHKEFFFKRDPNMLCAMMYGTANPFLESVEIANFIRANSAPQDKVAVIGSEPQICFYGNRLPATGFIYMYPLMEEQSYSLAMQREMIAEIEKKQPKFLIYIDSPYSWLRQPKSPGDLFRWFKTYRQAYEPVGIIDMNTSRKATYVWREAIENYSGKGEHRIWVYERK